MRGRRALGHSRRGTDKGTPRRENKNPFGIQENGTCNRPKTKKPRRFTSEALKLRETHEDSNYILFRIPIQVHLFERGLQAICMDSHRLPEILRLSDTAIGHLRQAGLVQSHPQRHDRKNVSSTAPWPHPRASSASTQQRRKVTPCRLNHQWNLKGSWDVFFTTIEPQQYKEPNNGLPRHGQAIPERMERTQC